MIDLLSDLADRPELALVPLALATIALLSLAVARRSSATARRSLDLAERQEKRRGPDLHVRYVSATCEVGVTDRRYIFDLILRNPSDRANAVAEAELWIEYSVKGEPMIVKVPWRPEEGPTSRGALVLPIGLDANRSAAGSLHLTVPSAVLAGRTVDRLRLVLSDTFGEVHAVSAEFVQERLTGTGP